MTIFRQFDNSKSDLTAVIKLWQNTFNDDETFIKKSIYKFCGHKNAYVAAQNGKIIAMLFAVPCHINPLGSGIYLYALATCEQFRGQGVMSALMKFAQDTEKQKGAVFACLIPAQKHLFEYYNKRGYVINASITTHVYKKTMASNANIKNQGIKCTKLNGTDLNKLRQKYIKSNYLCFNNTQFNVVCKDLCLNGAKFAKNKGAYAVYKFENNNLNITEFAYSNVTFAQDLLNAICKKHNVTEACVQSPCQNIEGLFLGSQKTTFALLKPLDNSNKLQNISNIYVRFAFEE